MAPVAGAGGDMGVNETLRGVIKQGLLAFVFISIGFALGKETTLRGAAHNRLAAPESRRDENSKVIVYYVHGSIRCATCRGIETMTKQVVETRFAKELAAGRLEWRTADFQKDGQLAEKYEVVSSGVVIVRTVDGADLEFAKLDEVWSLNKQPDRFRAYVGNAIAAYLEGARP